LLLRTTRDLAIVGLMLLQGLRSAEVLELNPDDVLSSEGQLRVRGKGSKLRFLPLAPETIQLLDHYMRLERPNPCSFACALFRTDLDRRRANRAADDHKFGTLPSHKVKRNGLWAGFAREQTFEASKAMERQLPFTANRIGGKSLITALR